MLLSFTDGFIEVKFDPDRAKEDDLFPPSMFDIAEELEDKVTKHMVHVTPCLIL